MVSLLPQVATVPQATKASIFYINDEHANVSNMERTKTASDEFDTFVPAEKTDKLKFAAGDIDVGKDVKLNKLAVAFQNAIGLMATAGGNHEFDLKKEDLADVLKNSNYKFLGLNAAIPDSSDTNKELNKEITKSYIQEQNWNKYGVIGLIPFDFRLHTSDVNEYKDMDIMTLEKAVPAIQKEIDDMKKQGVDKIVVLSHAGYESDVKMAKAVDGIDVIVGGHTHNLIEGIEEGKNLFYSQKTGAPTIITQAGKDGKYFGVLNLEFNDKGVVTKAQNNVTKTEGFAKSPIMQSVTDMFLGKPQVVGQVASSPKHGSDLDKENPTADFIVDALKSELGVDVAIMNSGNFRSSIEQGPLTTRDLVELTPFKNKICVVNLTEKELVDGIKTGAKSMNEPNKVPGLLQVSGLKYTISTSGEVKDLKFVDKDGKESSIDVKNPNPFKSYRVGVDDFVAKGGNKYFPNKYDVAETKFDNDKDKFVIDYIQKSGKPIEIKTDGRIKVEDWYLREFEVE